MNKFYILAVALLFSLSVNAANAQSSSNQSALDKVAPPPATSTIIVYYGSRKATLEFTDGKLTQWDGNRSDITFGDDNK